MSNTSSPAFTEAVASNRGSSGSAAWYLWWFIGMKSKAHPSVSVTDFGDPRSLTFFASFRATASSSSAANGVEEQGWKRQVISESEARSHPGGGPRQRRSSFAVRSSGFGVRASEATIVRTRRQAIGTPARSADSSQQGNEEEGIHPVLPGFKSHFIPSRFLSGSRAWKFRGRLGPVES